ncbi:MAG: sulfotransferase [Candidatus Thiodiazotropha sp. LLP2]
MSYKILDIKTTKDSRIRGFHLDTPILDSSNSGYKIHLSGWILANEAGIKQLEITSNRDNASYSIHYCTLSVERPDVAGHFRDDTINPLCGFSTSMMTLGLPQNADLSIIAITHDDQTFPVANLKLERTPTRTEFQAKLQPIIITTIGRTGSTWLMQLLAKHPTIVVSDQHPYETFALEYWLHLVSQQLLSPQQGLSLVDQQRFNRDFLSNETRHTWFNERYYSQVMSFCQAAVENYYFSIAEEQEVDTPQFFAEKIPYFSGEGSTTWRQLSSAVRELYPESKEIVLVRDFRDMVLSALHFGAKGKSSNEIEKEKLTAYQNVSKEVAEFSAYYKQNHNNTYLLHYEDLLLNTTSTLRSLFTSLSLPCSDKILGMVTQDTHKVPESHRQHITSQSVEKSVARWKRELAPQQQSEYTNIFKSNLRLFGYDI